jgi:hypothetical protein
LFLQIIGEKRAVDQHVPARALSVFAFASKNKSQIIILILNLIKIKAF